MTNETPYARGGSFLCRPTAPDAVFTPEDFTSEQRMYAKTAREFMVNEVVPVSDRLEEKDFPLVRQLLRKAGELGLLMADVPEEYGGLALDKGSCALIAENIAGQGSFQTVVMAHTGIGTLPVVYYGTPVQKEKYLPGLADGSLVGCYCLTEPSAGSDALSGRTKAVLTPDGRHYVLNGTKQFITNAGIADVFTVFAKVDGQHFTGFVLDRGTPGLKLGPEEHKMGIRGSSTTSVILEDALVPVENVLGEIGKGHKIAFNILNIGRFKLGAGGVGSAKWALEAALAYALERKQFGKRLVEFGAIREKLASMYVHIYAAESATYRTIGLIDRLLASCGDDHGEASLRSIEEYSLECALVKIIGSEALDVVVDETVQCFGGYGFCAEYPAERYYRDSRISRIYEGTNEINRILVPTVLLRRAAAGDLHLFGTPEPGEARAPTALAGEQSAVASLKQTALLVLRVASERHGKALAGRQEVLLRAADLVLAAYTAECTLLRALKDVGRRGEEGAALAVAAARLVCDEALDRAQCLAREGLTALASGDELLALLAALKPLGERPPVDRVALRDVIAAKLVEEERLVV